MLQTDPAVKPAYGPSEIRSYWPARVGARPSPYLLVAAGLPAPVEDSRRHNAMRAAEEVTGHGARAVHPRSCDATLSNGARSYTVSVDSTGRLNSKNGASSTSAH